MTAEPSTRDPLCDAIAASLRQKPQLRDALRTLATELLHVLDTLETSPAAVEIVAPVEPPIEPSVAVSSEPTVDRGPLESAPPPQPPLPRYVQVLNLGGVETRVEVIGNEPNGVTLSAPKVPPGLAGPRVISEAPSLRDHADSSGPDLSLVIERCRLKVEACRWASERRRRMAEGEDYRVFADGYRDLIARAKTHRDCYLWMIPADARLPSDADMAQLAECYAALADAAELVLTLLGAGAPDAPLTVAFGFLAEAQSALRVGLLPVLEYDRTDADQRDGFLWLREQVYARQVFVERFMRMDDPGSPEAMPDLRRRITEVRAAGEARHRTGKERRNLLSKVRYQANKAAHARPGSGNADWQRLNDLVEEAVAAGLPATLPELREALTPPLEGDVPDDVQFGPGMRAAMDEVDRHLSAAPEPEAPAAPPERSADVRQVADILRGKKLVLIGGHCRPQAQRAIERAFELDELIWPTTNKHESNSTFEPLVAKPSVAAVIVAIRWSSHSYGDLALVCAKYGKPFIRLKAGYNPSQVANAILTQARNELSVSA